MEPSGTGPQSADATRGPGYPVPTCCACILHQGRLLLILRAQEPGRGNWSFPGGRIEFGETIVEAVKREALEETCLQIEPLQTFQVYDDITRGGEGSIRFHYLVHYVGARYVSGEPCARDDAAGIMWAGESELADLTMHPFVRDTALQLLRAAVSPETWRNDGDALVEAAPREVVARGSRPRAPASGARPIPCCYGCVLHEGRLLLVQRGREPGRGKWSFPGGHMELGETVFEATRREVLEETGIAVEPLAWAGVHDSIMLDEAGRVQWHSITSYVRARLLSGEPCAGDDALQARWFTEGDIASLPMHPTNRGIALRLLRLSGYR